MGKREDNREDRRQRIVAAARELMQRRASAGFSMRALAELAGVSSATPYALFGSKQAIIAAVMDTDFDEFAHALKRTPAEGLDLFFQVIEVSQALFERNPGYFRTGAQALQATADKALAAHFGLPRHGLLRDLVRESIQRGDISHRVDADSLALHLGQQFYGWIQAWAREDITATEMTARAAYGFALTLAAVASDEHRERLSDLAFTTQQTLPEAAAFSARGESQAKEMTV